jgi:hypothetical protein
MSFNRTEVAQATLSAAPTVAINVRRMQAAQAACKGDRSGLFSVFVALAEDGYPADKINVFSAEVRQAVREELRERAGFTRVKVKGAKEESAPDYSTASVYGATVANWLTASRDYPALLAQALQGCQPESGEIPCAETCGIPTAQSTASRVLSKFAEIKAAAVRAEMGDMLRPVNVPEVPTVAQLEADNAALRARVEDLLKAGTPDSSVAVARHERDVAINERDDALAQVAALRSEIATMQAIEDAAAGA